MKILKHIHLRPAAWVAIAIGICHFAVTLLEGQCVLWFLGGSEYSMFRDETFPAIIWFPVSLFVDPTEITVPMHYFPLLRAWLSLLALCVVSSAWGLYAYLITRMATSDSRLNRKLIAAWGVYAITCVTVFFLPVLFPALLTLLSVAGILGALAAIVVAANAHSRTALPGAIFVAANMCMGAWFSYAWWGLSQL